MFSTMTKIVLSIVATLNFVGSGSIAASSSQATLSATTISTSTAPPSAQVANATKLTDGIYAGTLWGEVAKITVRDGQPVYYSWGTSFETSRVWMNNNIIHVQKARLRITALNSNTIQGIWMLGYKTKPVTLTRR